MRGLRSGNWIVLYAEQEIRRDQHGFNRELNPLFGGLVISLGQVDKSDESGNFISSYRAAVRAAGQRGDDSVDASRPRIRITDENLLAARLLDVSGKRPDELYGIEKLILLVAIGIFCGQTLHEI